MLFHYLINLFIMNNDNHFLEKAETQAAKLYDRALKAEEALRKIREEIPSVPKMPLTVNILHIIDNYFKDI